MIYLITLFFLLSLSPVTYASDSEENDRNKIYSDLRKFIEEVRGQQRLRKFKYDNIKKIMKSNGKKAEETVKKESPNLSAH